MDHDDADDLVSSAFLIAWQRFSTSGEMPEDTRPWLFGIARNREVLALVAFDGLTDVQAATVLGCRRATFRMRLNRARRRLRDALEPAAGLPSPV
ncbi:sigma factor-like helix-turn-helix DNA-binding protein [Actinoplanes couchii]|uniref:sigma factor-like helix-turn-helix DNA-binding protein n=1 Tax=Actinoplanes couchii TaxID=403638 RepID=UPI001EF2EE62|nr:sigma factor-like helix-turn-helix DNA-binding protein [Actinoplanes couchii]MDR6316078.1 RNA polymerase sigma-70 factor (ECF subfamily) [Actinoplanes couchii]